MKYLLFSLIFSSQLYSKEVFVYSCEINKELKTEISLLDKNTPSVDLFYNQSKFANCLFENTPLSHPANPRAQIQEAIWQLKLKSCSYYFEKHRDKIKVDKDVTFKQSSNSRPSYLAIVENQQPVLCVPKK